MQGEYFKHKAEELPDWHKSKSSKSFFDDADNLRKAKLEGMYQQQKGCRFPECALDHCEHLLHSNQHCQACETAINKLDTRCARCNNPADYCDCCDKCGKREGYYTEHVECECPKC